MPVDLAWLARRFQQRGRLLARGLALLCAVMLPLWAAWAAAPSEIWFAPKGGRSQVPGVADYATLFRPETPGWTAVEAMIQVYSVNFDHLMSAPDDEITRMAADLHAHGVKLAIGGGMVAKIRGNDCSKGEGYSWPGSHEKLAERLTRLNARPDIVFMDSPMWFGRYDPHKCQLSVPDLIQHLTADLTAFRRAFPAATFGDVEPWLPIMDHANWRDEYRAMKDGIAAATGVRLAFAHGDIGGNRPNWAATLTAVPPFVRSLGMRYGVIYDGRGRDASDEAWIASAKQKIAAMEDEQHMIPDDAVIGTWNHYPARALPPSDPMTLSGLLQYYLSRHR